MATPSLQGESRRRLPQAPNNDTSVRLSEVNKRPDCFDMEHGHISSSVVKKRLTPEVVAMLLSLDYGSDTTKANTVVESNSSAKCGGQLPRDNVGHSNTKVVLENDVGLVNILKTSGQPLGFSLREFNMNKREEPGGIFVSRLTPGGIVEQNSLLSTGDEILEINHVAVKDYKLSDVVAMIQIPKKLTLKVRFRRISESTEVSRWNKEESTVEQRGIVRNRNNNVIFSVNNELLSSQTDSKQGTQTSTKVNVVRETAPGALKFRRNSSGRVLPAPPESEQSRLQNSTHREGRLNPRTANKPVSNDLTLVNHERTTFINSNFNNTENTISNQSVVRTRTNKEMVYSNAKTEHGKAADKARNQKRSTVTPALINERKYSQEKGSDSQDGRPTSKRLDPGDIKFDILATNNPKYIVSRTLDEIKIEAKEDDTSKSSFGKTSETFGSSSSLSSTDSPKAQCRKSKNSSSSIGSLNLSRSDMLTHSSRLSDGSPISSSAESEDQMSKGFLENFKQRPQLLHSISSDDLNQSHNSWFSKIGNQKRKHVRKFSEGTQQRTFSKSAAFGEPYRIQESTDVTTDDAEHGYRLYPGTPDDTPSRAVTGMLTLHIVKGAQIDSVESVTGEKRKKAKVFCCVDSDGMRQASTTPKKGLNDFEWNESFEIELQRTREVRIMVCSRSKKEDTKHAEGCLNLAQLLSEGSEHLLAICLEPAGMLCVKLKFTDMKFLLQRTPSQKKEGVFGFPLETVLRRENSKIPNLIRKCVEEINDRGLETTGIYRICGNAAKKKVLRAQFENNSANVELNGIENRVDVNVITGLLKDYLRELPQPLLSQNIRELLCETEGESPPDNLVSQIIKKFPRPSKTTIMYVLDHFVTVMMNRDVNKMDSHNLAVCIGPVLLCPSLGGNTSTTVSDTKKDINAIKLLLEIWPKPEQISAC